MKSERSTVDQSAASIAATVPRPALLRQLEDRLADQAGLYETVQSEMRALIADNFGDMGDRAIVAPMRRLEASRREIETEINRTRARLAPLRRERGEAVATALNPIKFAAAQRCRAAIDELRDCLSTLGEAEDAIRQAGGDPGQPVGTAAGFIGQLSQVVDSILQPEGER